MFLQVVKVDVNMEGNMKLQEKYRQKAKFERDGEMEQDFPRESN